MTRHIKPYRYEVQHSNDADFVAYQRKSSHGVWQTISMWMIPQPSGISAEIVSASLGYPTSRSLHETHYIVLGSMFILRRVLYRIILAA